MHAKYTADPATWTVPKLASAFGVSQPRVQAILLLTEWEKKDREIGKLTEEDELLEELVRPQDERCWCAMSPPISCPLLISLPAVYAFFASRCTRPTFARCASWRSRRV